jgi:hypothetical protein
LVEASHISITKAFGLQHGFRLWELLALFVLILFLAIRWNSDFSEWSGKDSVLIGSDVQAIVAGYHHSPNLLIDGLRWWHGPWIEEGIQVYRPVSSYLLWTETWIGLHWGFQWVGRGGGGITSCSMLSLRRARLATNAL